MKENKRADGEAMIKRGGTITQNTAKCKKAEGFRGYGGKKDKKNGKLKKRKKREWGKGGWKEV
ncbi:hypothetical protein JL975_13575 [Acinetobacter baumannii]|nr:hypothetical protein [Acinetobacter baumannii]